MGEWLAIAGDHNMRGRGAVTGFAPAARPPGVAPASTLKEPLMLEDVLVHGLSLVICGMAAGPLSAARGEYYAGRNNKFWRTLFEVGLTPRQLAPAEFRQLPTWGIGLTDIMKVQAGRDATLDLRLADRDGLRRKIERFAPALVAFNGRAAAKFFLDRPGVVPGVQPERIGGTRLFVAPSTSGAAGGHWDLEPWQELAQLVRDQRVD